MIHSGGIARSTIVSEVVECVKDVKNKRAFGLFLGLSPGELDEINKSPSTDSTISRIVIEWYKKHQYSSTESHYYWEQVCTVLTQPAVDEPALARGIQRHFLLADSIVNNALAQRLPATSYRDLSYIRELH